MNFEITNMYVFLKCNYFTDIKFLQILNNKVALSINAKQNYKFSPNENDSIF